MQLGINFTCICNFAIAIALGPMRLPIQIVAKSLLYGQSKLAWMKFKRKCTKLKL